MNTHTQFGLDLSPHAYKLDTELNDACTSSTECLRPINVEELCLLVGMALPDLRRDACARVEKNETGNKRSHSLHVQVPAERRMKRECFLSSVRPAAFHAKVFRCSEWQRRKNLASHTYAIKLDKGLPKGKPVSGTAWISLNRLRTGVTCSNGQRKRWKYSNGEMTCECGQAPEPTKHMLQCPLLTHLCTLDDLLKFNEYDRKCVDKWNDAV